MERLALKSIVDKICPGCGYETNEATIRHCKYGGRELEIREHMNPEQVATLQGQHAAGKRCPRK